MNILPPTHFLPSHPGSKEPSHKWIIVSMILDADNHPIYISSLAHPKLPRKWVVGAEIGIEQAFNDPAHRLP